MGWDTYEYVLQCATCGRRGKEIVRENDWMQSETYYENFKCKWVAGRHPGMKDAQGDSEIPVCPACGDKGVVRRLD